MHTSKRVKILKKVKLNETIIDEEKLYRYNSEEENFSDNKLKGQALEGKFQREDSLGKGNSTNQHFKRVLVSYPNIHSHHMENILKYHS